jgi:transcription initiation factor TFIID subunit 11
LGNIEHLGKKLFFFFDFKMKKRKEMDTTTTTTNEEVANVKRQRVAGTGRQTARLPAASVEPAKRKKDDDEWRASSDEDESSASSDDGNFDDEVDEELAQEEQAEIRRLQAEQARLDRERELVEERRRRAEEEARSRVIEYVGDAADLGKRTGGSEIIVIGDLSKSVASREFQMQERAKAMELAAVIGRLDAAQMDRYEVFRRSAFPRAAVRKIMAPLLAQSTISENCAIVMGGIAKLFVGELVECALHVSEERGHSGPLLPEHIQEAHRRFIAANRIPYLDTPNPFIL